MTTIDKMIIKLVIMLTHCFVLMILSNVLYYTQNGLEWMIPGAMCAVGALYSLYYTTNHIGADHPWF